MIESLLIKNIQLVSTTDIKQGDIYIEKGKIKAIGPHLNVNAEQIIHEPSLYALPGLIDPHVHFRDPGNPEKETLSTGSKAAAAGGITSFFDMPNTNPATISIETLEQKKKQAAKQSLINYNFFIGATQNNLDELNQAENIPGIKIYVGSSTGSLLVNDINALRNIFKSTQKLIAVHSEDEEMIQKNQKKHLPNPDPKTHLKIRTEEAALTCTKKLVQLAQETQTRLHICHLSTKQEALFLKQLIPQKLISTEVTLQHLSLDAQNIYDQLGSFALLNPPIRDKSHSQVLWEHLKQGLINCVASDHSPHTIKQKQQPYGKAPSGIPSVQTQLPLLLTKVNQNQCLLQDIVKWMAEGPAQTFNIQNKGRIEPGYDGDITIIDLKKKKTITKDMLISNAGWSPYENWTCQGVPIITIVNGQMVFREGDFFEEIKGKEVQLKP